MRRVTIEVRTPAYIVETYVIDHLPHDGNALDPSHLEHTAPRGVRYDRTSGGLPQPTVQVVEDEVLYMVVCGTGDDARWLTHANRWTLDPTYAGYWPEIRARHHVSLWNDGKDITDARAVAL